MTILRITRFTADPANEQELLKRRADLLTVTRAAHPGLLDTRLAKVDERTWVDVWQWESDEALERAVAWAHSGAAPQAPAAFELVEDVSAETGTLVG